LEQESVIPEKGGGKGFIAASGCAQPNEDTSVGGGKIHPV
jgi:hypothetical protein